MSELLRNAWMGWLAFSKAGKLGGVLLLVLVTLWLLKLGKERQRTLLLYTTVMTVLCIFPVTAAVLMLWQTKFYDYQWIWTVVPVTGMIACGCVLFLDWIWKGSYPKKAQLVVTCLVLGMLLLCGGIGSPDKDVRDLKKERKEIAAVLSQVRGESDGKVCLWAPKEVIAQARTIDPQIILLYGRNMWEAHLNAYSYDVYDQDRRNLYVWMVMIGRYGTLDVPAAVDVDVVGDRLEPGSHMEGLSYVRKAVELGANRILLPGIMKEEALETLRGELGAETSKVGNYWLITFTEGIKTSEVRNGR